MFARWRHCLNRSKGTDAMKKCLILLILFKDYFCDIVYIFTRIFLQINSTIACIVTCELYNNWDHAASGNEAHSVTIVYCCQFILSTVRRGSHKGISTVICIIDRHKKQRTRRINTLFMLITARLEANSPN